MIQKFEMFIDICNQRVMVQREKLASDGDDAANGAPPSHPSHDMVRFYDLKNTALHGQV